MKHKVGDIVRIKSRKWYDAKEKVGGYIFLCPYGFTIDMSTYCGAEAKIIEVREDSYFIDIDGRKWLWTDEMFEDETFENKVNIKYGVIKEIIITLIFLIILSVTILGLKEYENIPHFVYSICRLLLIAFVGGFAGFIILEFEKWFDKRLENK